MDRVQIGSAIVFTKFGKVYVWIENTVDVYEVNASFDSVVQMVTTIYENAYVTGKEVARNNP